jgi:FecR-like protein
MNGKTPKDIPEENIERLIAASAGEPDSDFQHRLATAVLDELHDQSAHPQRQRPRTLRWVAALLALAASIVALVAWNLSDNSTPHRRYHHPRVPIAQAVPQGPQVMAIFGLVSLENGPLLHQQGKSVDVELGQGIRTCSGSRAGVQLSGDTHLGIDPRSQIHVADSSKGERLVLSKGSSRLWVNVDQKTLGNTWTVETPGAELTVSPSPPDYPMTLVDIHVIEKPNGRKQTRASVEFGSAELAAAGQRVVLLPNMEGVVDEGGPPRTRSLTAEVNEINRLIEQTETLAVESGVQAGCPSIVEFNGEGKPTLWTVFPIPNTTDTELTRYKLPLPASTEILGVYTLDGVKDVYFVHSPWVNLLDDPVPPGGETRVIVKYSGQQGMFENAGAGTHEFNSPPGEAGKLSLVQFRLPASARVEELSPSPIETRKTLSRLSLTVAVNGHSFDTLF